MDFLENVRLAIDSIRSNWLRAILTMMIIALGIMALVGILTAIDSAIYSLNDNLSSIGSNTFDVDPKGSGISGNRGGRRAKRGESFTYKQVIEFKDRYDFPSRPSVSFNCTGNATIKYKDEKTNPNVNIFAVDDNYFEAKGFDIEYGRGFSSREIFSGSFNTVIGSDIVKQLFDNKPDKALNQVISAGNIRLKVIGILKSKGSSMNASEDRRIMIPLYTGKRYFATEDQSYNILVAVNDASQIDNGIATATGLLTPPIKKNAYPSQFSAPLATCNRVIVKKTAGLSDTFEMGLAFAQKMLSQCRLFHIIWVIIFQLLRQ